MDDREQPHAEVVFMGEGRVGKTALIQRIIKGPNSNIWDDKYEPTIEDSFIREFVVKGNLCRLRLIDTAGSYMFPAMNRLWHRRGSAFVLVCARDDASSLDRIKTILKEIQEERPEDYRKLIIVIVVNKNDIRESEWLITDEEVESVADESQIPFSSIISASARDNYGVIDILKVMWKKNQEAGENGIIFDPLPPHVDLNDGRRRASAFAVLFRNSSTKGATVFHIDGREGPRHSCTPTSNRLAISTSTNLSNESSFGTTFIKKLGRLSLGGHRNTKRDKTNLEPAVIKLDCTIS
ncbi:unnamed protein product [Trichobilharzia regenti]|uniref:GTP-binding protein Di-Ras2 n=1 Tax=Trichobilharzia regenti TaxID=157069 RepID=A0A183WJE1_TRIRE|nr:unnamed protein product [Trichobilharzia regenti]VDQ08124.1 unnamed protein product [Trichobilharzia regenti]